MNDPANHQGNSSGLFRFALSLTGLVVLFAAVPSRAFADTISDQLIITLASRADQVLNIMESAETTPSAFGPSGSVSGSFKAFDGTYCLVGVPNCGNGQSNVLLVEPNRTGISDQVVANIAFSNIDPNGRTIDIITITMFSYEDAAGSDPGEISDVTANLFSTVPAGSKITAISIEAATPEPGSLYLAFTGVTGLFAAVPSIRRRRASR